MGRLNSCALKCGVVQWINQNCALGKNWRALRHVGELTFLRIGLNVFIAERLTFVVLLSLIVHKVVVAVIGSRSLIALRRFIKLS